MDKEASRPSKKARRGAVDSGGGLAALALRLSKTLAERKEHAAGKNVAFSPLSVYAALGLAAAGARGTTLDELLALLGAASRDEAAELMRAMAEHALAADPSGPLVVTFACGVWCHESLKLKPAYRQAAVDSYKAEARAVDFVGKAEEAREEINGWIAEATKNLITSVLPPGSLDGDTRLVLANAIYFNGKWKDAFSKSRTKDRKFHRLDGAVVRVPFMAAGAGRRKSTLFSGKREALGPEAEYFVACHDGFKVLKLPYKSKKNNGGGGGGARYSMCVFLPDARDGLPGLVDRMASGGPGFLSGHLPGGRRAKVRKLRLPKFKLSFSCSMKGALETLGLRAAFTERADFSDMVVEKELAKKDSGEVDDVPLRVEEVFHKAVVEVDEEGTVAAASSAVRFVLYCASPPPVDFVADHPFSFFIVEEVSGAVVFTGHVLDPSETSE